MRRRARVQIESAELGFAAAVSFHLLDRRRRLPVAAAACRPLSALRTDRPTDRQHNGSSCRCSGRSVPESGPALKYRDTVTSVYREIPLSVARDMGRYYATRRSVRYSASRLVVQVELRVRSVCPLITTVYFGKTADSIDIRSDKPKERCIR